MKGLSMEELAAMRKRVDDGTKEANRKALQRPQTISAKEYASNKGKRSKGREHSLQVACVRWFRAQYPQQASLLLSVPNGAALKHGYKSWNKLKNEGAVAGAPDLLLLIPSGDYGFLCLEMKTEKGKQQPSQKQFEEVVVRNGGAYCIPRSLEQFQNMVNSYLERGEF